MNERQRMQYLEAMGIAYYVPRWQLPAAKVSKLCELPAANALDTAELEEPNGAVPAKSPTAYPMVPELDTENVQELSRLDAIVADLDKEKRLEASDVSASSANLSEIAPVPQELETQETATFSLSLWRAGPDLQVIDSRRPGDALPTQALLVNILSAASLLQLNLPKAEHINWPMVDTHSDKSWAAAREMLTGFFEGRFAAQPVKCMFIFGEAAFKALVSDNTDFTDQLYTTKTLSALSVEALILPSLSEILYSPQIKSKVWSGILQIRQGLLS